MDPQSINQKIDPLESLTVGLQGLDIRSKAIAGNIANLNTPGYKRQIVKFEEALQEVQKSNKLSDIPLDATNPKHFTNSVYRISDTPIEVTTDNMSLSVDENSVDIDKEMLELTKTGLRYKALTNMSKKYFESMRGIIGT